MSELLEAIQPKYLISGHYHHLIGPQDVKQTKYVGLNILVPPVRRDESRSVQPGSIAVLDTDEEVLEAVKDEWLSQINKNFNFKNFIQELKAHNSMSVFENAY